MKNPKNTFSSSGPRVAVASISFSKSAFLREELEREFPNSFFNELGRRFSENELIDFLKGADAAVIGIEPITDQVLNQLPQLKIISKYGVGLDSIDQESLKRRNIALGWTGGVNRRSVSELTLCFMLGLCRNVFTSGFSLKQSKWEKEGGCQLTGKTVGIIGCGNIGSDVVELLAPLQCTFLVCDILDKSEFCRKNNATQTSLENLIEQSDVISLHVPFTQRTNKMADKKMFDQMKSTAFLVNTCRGDVVDQEALKTALTNGYIAGAALDVFAEEPPTDQEFLSLPNLMTTPHIGGNAKEAIDAMGRSAIDHLVSFFKNNLPHKS
ncbi:MAG: phosphoglycerate dehydrogenase [Nitrospina sp.]|jgi:D-3-phosphoglycerate dehydrogenase|nr:phosphoglycerate dehydrogenase [Nitrospina sp.]